jgi:Xaa-Pro aminopeptidase
MNENLTKLTNIRELLDQHHLDAILLRRVSSFAWATCGANAATNSAETFGSAILLITKDDQYLITSKTEESRLAEEEALASQGWQFVTHPWYAEDALAHLTSGLRVGADSVFPGAIDLSEPVARLRAQLSPPEIIRMKQLCTDCAAAMAETMHAIQPGITEHEIAALLSSAVEKRGIRPVVNLVGTDQRIFTYRHPLPTAKKLEKFALVVLCGRRQGLVSNLTRLIHFGPIPQDLQQRARAVAEIDAAFISSSTPGTTLGEMFAVAQDAYSKNGYPDEWRILHQGGIAGYEPREFTAVPGSQEVIHPGHFLTWNPTLAGVKSEDTIFLGEGGVEIVTELEGWPMMSIQGRDGKTYKRPAILEK